MEGNANISDIFGGGESLGLMVRRGAKDPEPSVTLRFSDDKFGMTGGYDAEIFSDYIAIDEEEKEVEKHGEAERDVVDYIKMFYSSRDVSFFFWLPQPS